MTIPIQAVAGGIAGETVLWPVSPVARPGIPNARPCQAVIGIADAVGRPIGRVRSDGEGWFEAALEPGIYRLHPEADAAGRQAEPQTVTVAAGRFTPVRIVYDSGIR